MQVGKTATITPYCKNRFVDQICNIFCSPHASRDGHNIVCKLFKNLVRSSLGLHLIRLGLESLNDVRHLQGAVEANGAVQIQMLTRRALRDWSGDGRASATASNELHNPSVSAPVSEAVKS